jgi:hypothetical protein
MALETTLSRVSPINRWLKEDAFIVREDQGPQQIIRCPYEIDC